MDTNENNTPNDPAPSPVPPPAPEVPPATPPAAAVPPPATPPPASPFPVVDASKDEKMFAMLAHLTAFSGCIVPFGNVIAPLVIWLIKKDTMPFVDDQAKESLNFQITLTIALVISAVLTMICIGWVLLIGLGIAGFVFIIMASIKANEGFRYRYPWTFRFIK